ncbi:dipeptide ABC transporter, substrate-binding protein [Escherichia coli]|nr:dipeptide ABC transporter, substrate-binding protein [Escherichia coli]
MRISLKKSGMLKLGLSLVAMTVAASVQAKNSGLLLRRISGRV